MCLEEQEAFFKKELQAIQNQSEYRFISLTNVAKEIIRKARVLNPDGEFIFERNGERITASRLSTKGIPLDKIRDMLGQVDEKTILSYIYNPNTEQENLNIMNEALKKSDRKNIKQQCTYGAHIVATKNPLKIKGFRKHETGFEPVTAH